MCNRRLTIARVYFHLSFSRLGRALLSLRTHPCAELLLILWGLFFIATMHDREPKLKARNFVKSIRTGTEVVTRRRRSLSMDSSASASRADERPYWENEGRGSHPNTAAPQGTAAAVGFPVAPFVNGGNDSSASVATRRASSNSGSSIATSSHQQTVS